MSSELVAVELQLKGYDGVMSDMRALDQMLNGFRGKKNRIEVESDIANTKRELVALRGEMNKLKDNANAIKSLMRDGIIPKDMGKSALDDIQNDMDEVAKKTRDATQRLREMQTALKSMSNASFKSAFDWISTRMAHLGSAMQSAGNALTRLTSPFARFTSGMVLGAGYQALNKFTSGLENGFNRYDTMKKYPKVMEAFGYSSEQAQKSIDALDKSVRGLPTGLDEIVDVAQRFTATTGDIDKGTKLAIASNNAFLASMSTDTQKYQGMMQLQDVLGGKDMNAREWNSLVSSMTPAIVKMGESLGYTSDNMSEWIQKVRDGNVANEDFIDTLIKVGTEGGSVAKMAENAKDTWQAFFANVGNAASRMTAGVIQALDEITRVMVGKDVNQYLSENLIPAIDNMTESVKGWIKAHPEEIADFFKSLKSVDWGSIIRGVGQGILSVADLIKSLANMFGGSDLSRIGRWMVQGNILGKFLTIAGGLIKGSRGIVGGIGATLVQGVRAFKDIRKAGGIAGWLGTLAVGDNARKTEKTIETVAKSSGKMGRFSTGLSKIFTGWTQVATMIGGSAFVAWGSMKLIKNAIKDFKETVDVLNTVDWDMGTKALGAIGGFFVAMGALSGLAGKFAGASGVVLVGEVLLGAFTTIASGVAALDMHLLKKAFKSFADLTEYFNQGIQNLNNIESVSNVGDVKNKVHNAITTFNQIIDMFQEPIVGGGRNNPVTGDAKTSKLKKLSGDVVKTVGGLKDSLGAMLDSVKTLNEISQIRVNVGGLTAVIPKIKVGLEKIGNLLGDLPEGMGSDGTAKNVSNMASAMQDFKTGLGALVGSDGVLAILPELASRIAKLERSGQIEKLNQQMDVLGRGLQQMMNSLNFGGNDTSTLLSDMTNISSAVDQIKQIISKLNGIGKVEVDTAGTDNIKTIIQNLKSAFDEAQATELSGQIIALVASVEAALAMFQNLNTDIEINPTVKLGSGFKSSVNKATGQIRSANGDIRSAVNSIQTDYFKRVNIRIAVNTIVSRMGDIGGTIKGIANDAYKAASGGSIGGQFSRNGVLYRSGGGSIFKPRGVDKIPAMLAEGEYVHKKQAVDFFGVDFMRKVNNMDVRGAMESLLTKAGTSVGIGRQSVVNNTVNNNQRITQNINTNNPNFARARMGRFVGAL